MKLVNFTADGAAHRLGALVDDGRTIVDLQMAAEGRWNRSDPAFASVLALIEADDDGLARAYDALRGAGAGARRDRASVALLAPIQPAVQIRDSLCFEEHLKNAFAQGRRVRARSYPDPEAALREMEEKNILAVPQVFYEQPIYYKANRFAVTGTDRDVEWPAYSNLMDFELEFGCYIKKPARNVRKEDARDYIFGYTIFNDFTARDAQMTEMLGQLGPAKGKDFDTGNAMGPCLVTADELSDPYNLKMTARVNGEVWGGGNSSSMHWSFEDLIAHISRSETLHPGEFLGSGTVGTGCGLELGRFLAPGDVVELEVEGIGVLRNRIVKR